MAVEPYKSDTSMTIQPAFSIRVGMEEDAFALAKLCSETFYATYHEANTPKNMQAYISEHFTGQHLLKELNDSDNIVFLASIGNALIGYISLNIGLKSHLDGFPAAEICRFYVLKKFQHLKVGRALINKAFEWTKTRGFTTIWLGVWQENALAISIYEHLGFVITGTNKFIFGDEVQDDFVMSRSMVTNSDPE